jgi:AraC family transcriptional regulator of adaptative response/methylated-DNA-[protein]-cysteine methyltransferase
MKSQTRARGRKFRVARAAGLSEFHFQRLFSRMVGISPKKYEQFLTKETAKRLLAESESLLDAAYDAGLSGPGRLHDLFVSCEAVTPGEFKSRGRGLTIRYGFHPTPFGEALLAITERGICALYFTAVGNRTVGLSRLH